MGCVMVHMKIVDSPQEDSVLKKGDGTTKQPLILGYELKGVNLGLAGRNSTKDINVFYEIDYDHILGTGASGPVRLCMNRQTQTQFALKRLSKVQIKSEKLKQLRAEIAIMIELDHTNILKLIEYFETNDEVYLILELCRGGELLDHLHCQPNHQYDEASACQLIYTMLSAINYCHTMGIMHCDLKLENFLFEKNDDKSQLKLIGQYHQYFYYI